ncbi:MAG: hypothetical protein EU549_00040 [Promethearchaeota archaeon]|nr:MAG: hypothetical protein EU549_00040 [Candidatus Lokiarchaeota archaeon]
MSHLKLDKGALTKAFVDEVRLNADNLHLFDRFSNEKFEKWQDNMGSLVDVADFMVDEGEPILIFWMTKIFSFHEKRLTIKVPKKLSPVDSQIVAKYVFSKDETKIIEAILEEYDLGEYGTSKAAKTIFSNSMKTISKYLSKIIKTDYKIFTNKLEHKEKKGKIFINYEGAGRIQGF